MNFEVYCDESRPDLLSTHSPQAQYMVIGSLWLQAEDREELKAGLHGLRNAHRVGGEFKWQKASPSRLSFYKELVDWFLAQGDKLRFRCIVVDHKQVDLGRFHENDQELGFYKFYFQLLQHWITESNEYSVFCDFKRNRVGQRHEVLRRCLDRRNPESAVRSVQAIRSEESVLIQLADVFTGLACARLNGVLSPGGAKAQIVEHLERGLKRRIRPTQKAEAKFNVFQIDLAGGR